MARNGKRVSDYIRIERSREARQWVNTGLKAAGIGIAAVMYLDNHPEVKRDLEERWERFANRFRKNPEIKVYPPTNK